MIKQTLRPVCDASIRTLRIEIIGSSGFHLARAAGRLQVHPIEVTRAMEDALDNDAIPTLGIENKIFPVHSDPNAHPIFLAQSVCGGIVREFQAMSAQFTDKAERTLGTIRRNIEGDLRQVGLSQLCKFAPASGHP
jgi:hypothetical protein